MGEEKQDKKGHHCQTFFNTKYVQRWRCIVSPLLKNYDTLSHRPVRKPNNVPPKCVILIPTEGMYVPTHQRHTVVRTLCRNLYILLRDKRDGVRVCVLCTYAFTALRSTLLASLVVSP